MKIVHYFLHKLFLAFYIKLFSVQYYLKNCLLFFMRTLFSVHYLYILCTPSRFGTFIDFPSIFSKFLHSTNSNFFTISNYSRHLPLGDLYESFIFLSWSLSIIYMVTYLKKHKNHLSAITAPMLKTVYAENNEQFL